MSGSYGAWPFGCPQEWRETTNPALIRTTMEDGYPKVRRAFTKDWHTFEGKWTIMASAIPSFRTFVDVVCQGGASPFTMEDPFVPATTRTFRFVEAPAIASDAHQMPTAVVTARLEEVFS
jgi:hypothetical protein